MRNTTINIENISLFNPWYKKKNFLYGVEEKLKKRWNFTEIKKYLEKEFILSLVGLRRTGKTTIIKHIINTLLQDNTPCEKIFFYEFGEEQVNLEKTLLFYFKNILKEDLYSTQCYIFLDELQMVEGWQDILKKYYDINPQIHFIISGSTHLYLHKKTKESLAGRIIDFFIHPLSWHEFLDFQYGKKYTFLPEIFADNFIEKIQEQSDILLYKEDFLTFLSFAEFPHFFKEKNLEDLKKYYKNSILEKIFLKDIQLFDIDNTRKFQDFFSVLSSDTAQELNFSNISREIGLSSQTIKRYISILEKMFLYSIIYKEEKSLRKKIKSFKKGYVQSLNLMSSIGNIDFWSLPKEKWGHIIETFIFQECVKNGVEEITFFHNTKEKKEVDFILKKEGIILPIEVKTSPQILPRHLKNLLEFSKKNNCKRAIIIYGGDEIKKEIISDIQLEFLPYWVF